MSRRTKAEVTVIKEAIIALCGRYKPMTVRQLFYALTVRDFIDKTEQEYKNIVKWAKELRLAGDLPWEWLADNTRWMHKPATYAGMADMLDRQQHLYRRALWDPAKNPNYVEIWLEKDALTGVFYDVTSEFDVPLMPCRGYPSLSFLRNAAETIVANLEHRVDNHLQPTATIYYFGDFDPSGVDISRSTEKRLRQFIDELYGDQLEEMDIDSFIRDLIFGGVQSWFNFERVAVNHEQIESMGLPTRPTKKSDSRSKNFGHDISVEVDAIDPDTLRDMIRGCITPHIDQDELDRLRAIEAEERQSLNIISNFTRAHSADELAQRLGL